MSKKTDQMGSFDWLFCSLENYVIIPVSKIIQLQYLPKPDSESDTDFFPVFCCIFNLMSPYIQSEACSSSVTIHLFLLNQQGKMNVKLTS